MEGPEIALGIAAAYFEEDTANSPAADLPPDALVKKLADNKISVVPNDSSKPVYFHSHICR